MIAFIAGFLIGGILLGFAGFIFMAYALQSMFRR